MPGFGKAYLEFEGGTWTRLPKVHFHNRALPPGVSKRRLLEEGLDHCSAMADLWGSHCVTFHKHKFGDPKWVPRNRFLSDATHIVLVQAGIPVSEPEMPPPIKVAAENIFKIGPAERVVSL